MNIHEWGEESAALRCREGAERGGGRLCILPESLFLAVSLSLSVYSPCMWKLNLAALMQKHGAETKIETSYGQSLQEQPRVQHHKGVQNEIDGKIRRDNWMYYCDAY